MDSQAKGRERESGEGLEPELNLGGGDLAAHRAERAGATNEKPDVAESGSGIFAFNAINATVRSQGNPATQIL